MTKFSTATRTNDAGNLICIMIHRDDAAEYAADGWSVGDEYFSEAKGCTVIADPLARRAIAEQGYTPTKPNGRSLRYLRNHPQASTFEAF